MQNKNKQIKEYKINHKLYDKIQFELRIINKINRDKKAF